MKDMPVNSADNEVVCLVLCRHQEHGQIRVQARAPRGVAKSKEYTAGVAYCASESRTYIRPLSLALSAQQVATKGERA